MDESLLQLMHRRIETTMTLGESMAGELIRTSQVLTNSLVSGNKVFCYGSGLHRPIANLMTQHLIRGFVEERPSFPAIDLSDATGQASVANKQLSALCQPGDCLLLFDAPFSPISTALAECAVDNGLVLLTFNQPQLASDSAPESILDITLQSDDKPELLHLQLVSMQAICHLIDEQLFGGY